LGLIIIWVIIISLMQKKWKNKNVHISLCADGQRCAEGHRRHNIRKTHLSVYVPTATVAPRATVGTVQTAP
jgi:hypothetical protein